MVVPELAPPTGTWTPVARPKDFESVFVRYKLRLTLLTKLCGGVPNKKELIRPCLIGKHRRYSVRELDRFIDDHTARYGPIQGQRLPAARRGRRSLPDDPLGDQDRS